MIEWEEYSNKVEIDRSAAWAIFPKHLALVKRGDKTFIRNYGRPLKNGKGMNRVDAEYALLGDGLKFRLFSKKREEGS
jgi:hypothetical protein